MRPKRTINNHLFLCYILKCCYKPGKLQIDSFEFDIGTRVMIRMKNIVLIISRKRPCNAIDPKKSFKMLKEIIIFIDLSVKKKCDMRNFF